ncbi:MAG: hypothetical protein KDA42_14815, partial [Planctomycetales bacterium]|nr:hypothetical protein [Planctomycetales bacterium]
KDTHDNPIAKEFRKLLDAHDMHRPGLGFYALRHTFETIGGDSRDQVAVDHVMGHSRDDMASLYRERIDDNRLCDVAAHVHAWLFPPKKKAKPRKPDRETRTADRRKRKSDSPRLRVVG